MMTTSLITLLTLLAFFGCACPRDVPRPVLKREITVDAVVIGGGAGGASSAVFLQDKGFSVAVIEKAGNLGGACDTIYFAPPSTNLSATPWWIDTGVHVYTNTTWANVNGYGNWTLATDVFVHRFVSPARTFASTISRPTYYTSDLTNPPYNPSAGIFPASSLTLAQEVELFEQLQLLLVYLKTNYPWLDSTSYPSPIPPELLVPFSTWLANNTQFAALNNAVFGTLLYDGGMGNWDLLPTLFAFENVRPGIIAWFFPGNIGSFTIIGGCQYLYDNIYAFLGAKNVYLNSTILSISRPAAGGEKEGKYLKRSVIRIRQSSLYDAFDIETTIHAKYIIHAVPQTLDLLDGMHMDTDFVERNLFGTVSIRPYFSSSIGLDGPLVRNGTTQYSLSISNYNLTAGANLYQQTAGIIACSRIAPVGPFGCLFGSSFPISDAEVNSTYFTQIERLMHMQNNSITSINTSQFEISRHLYQPHFSLAELATKTPYQTLASIQGRRNTYWVGALASFAESGKVWEHAYRIINPASFPLYS